MKDRVMCLNSRSKKREHDLFPFCFLFTVILKQEACLSGWDLFLTDALIIKD